MSKECGHTCPLGQYAEATYDGAEYNAGPAIRVSTGSGRFAMHGLVALYVPAQNGIAVVLYDGEPLSGIGTVITTYSGTLALGDVLRIEADDGTPTLYRVRVNGTALLEFSVSDALLPTLNSCVGFVEVFAVPDGTIVIPEPPPPDEEAMIVVKSADQSKTSDTTLAMDSELFIPVGASETWVMRLLISTTSPTSVPDFKLTIAGPSGSSGYWLESYDLFAKYPLGTSAFESTGPTATDFIIDALCVNGVTAGNFGLQWAQNTSSTDFSKVLAQSYLIAFKKA